MLVGGRLGRMPVLGSKEYLQCQLCGCNLGKELSFTQKQEIALRPYDFIVYCSPEHRKMDTEPGY